MENIDYLKQIDIRIQGLRINNPDSTELTRMTEVIRPDVYSKLTAEELVIYEKGTTISEEERERIRLEDIARMEMNKDSASI